jgi:hypothetical protein
MQIRKKGGMKLKKIFSETTEAISTKLSEMILRWSPFNIVSVSAVLYPDVLTDTILKGDHLRIISAKYS